MTDPSWPDVYGRPFMAWSEHLSSRMARFTTTRWSLVVAAGERSGPPARAALATLCEAYWYPLYAYVRRRGCDSHEARDVVQGFFAHLIEKNAVDAATPEKGRFRSFLLASLKNFLANRQDHAGARKRGGGRRTIPIDACDAEARYRFEPVDHLDAERLYERHWALTLLEVVLARLRQECECDGRGQTFEVLKGLLGGPPPNVSFARIGEQLSVSAAAAKMKVSRLRRRYRELLRDQIRQTVGSPEHVEDEIRHLFLALRR